MSALPPQTLRGLKVLDLSRLLPGPYATLVLADLGAQVDKVESPDGGDPMRVLPPLHQGEGAFFHSLNRNKRSLTLDLKSADGAEAVRTLAGNYDVLVESFRPGVKGRLGLDAATLRGRHPRLIYCSISGYGQTGPDRLKAGHDLNYAARAGLLGFGAPAMPGGQVADVGGSLFGLVGILAALYQRERTGEGQTLDISMTESATAFAHMHLAARALPGSAPEFADILHGGFAGYNLYATADGRTLAVASLEPKVFQPLCEKLGRAELFEQGYDPGPAGKGVRDQLVALFASKPLAAWLELFADSDLCIEPVLRPEEVPHDAQHRARGLVSTGSDGVSHWRTPLGTVVPTAPPRLGQHSREILLEGGFTEAQMQRLGVPGR